LRSRRKRISTQWTATKVTMSETVTGISTVKCAMRCDVRLEMSRQNTKAAWQSVREHSGR
jgi:hypothetical protein